MKKNVVGSLALMLVLTLTLAGCGEKKAALPDHADQQYYEDLAGEDLAGAGGGNADSSVQQTRIRPGSEGWEGYQRAIHDNGPYDYKNSGVTRVTEPNRAEESPLEELGDGVKDTIGDMGRAAEDLARDVKNSMS